MAAGLIRRRLALAALLGVSLTLGGCSTFSGLVSDTWPTWAGGEPKDVPPRPGAPGYEEFISHQQRQDPAAGSAAPGAAPGAAAVAPGAAPATTATVQPMTASRPASAPNTRSLPPAYAPADDKSATKGGLY